MYDSIDNLHRIHWIQNNAPQGLKIVDIGGNKGHVFDGYDRSLVTTVDIDLYDIPNFVQADAENLPFKDKEFDVAVVAEILEHCENPDKALKEACRVAKKVVVTVPYEHLWIKELDPFRDFNRVLEETKGDLGTEALKGNPDCKSFHTEDNYKHLFHHRFYTPETFEDFISKNVYSDYYICLIKNGGLWNIGAIIV